MAWPTARHSPEPKVFNVIDETEAAFGTAICFPEETGSVDDIPKEYWSWNVSQQAEYHKLHTQCKRALLVPNGPAGK